MHTRQFPAPKLLTLCIGLASWQAYADVPATSDYYQDPTQKHVAERSADVFGEVNGILCQIAQTRYDAMLNKGNYVALIDQNACNSDNENASSAASSSQNQSSGSNSPNYSKWTISSSRPDNNSAQTVNVWVNQKSGPGDMPMQIQAKMVVTQASSTQNPLGLFTVNFQGFPKINGQVSTTPVFQGYLSAALNNGAPTLSFYNSEPMNKVAAGTLQKDSNGGGVGSTSGDDGTAYAIAFNSGNFLRAPLVSGAVDTTNQKCYSRGTFDVTAWRYGLYDATTGSRIKVQSGFPVKVTQNGVDYYGWDGFYGLWFPSTVTLSNGDTVYKMDYSSNSSTPYTVHQSGGKLFKMTRKTLTLDDIAGIPLDWSSCNATTCSQYEIYWDKGKAAFYKTKQMSQPGTQQMSWVDISPAVALGSTDFQGNHELMAFSQAVGGSIRVSLFDFANNYLTPTGTTTANITLEQVVYPNTAGVPTSLSCYDQCPSGANINTANPFYQNNGTAHSYTFDMSSLVLSDNGTKVIQTTSASTSGGMQYGVRSGPLFDPTNSSNVTALQCPGNASQTCPWLAWENLPVFYQWETGTNPWNQMVLLEDSSGVPQIFSPPLHVQYVFNHATAQVTTGVSTPPDGTKFMLEYQGMGNLMGIPGDCVDPETNQKAACAPAMRWIPQFTILNSLPNGSTVTDVNSPQTSYLVKILDEEERMQTSAGNCTGLTLQALPLPGATGFTAPGIGSEPVVTQAPAVIGGTLQ